MKNQGVLALVIVCCLFLGVLFGLFLGRTLFSGDILISQLPEQNTSSHAKPTEDTAAEVLVDINTATVEQLDLLPGIGPVLAQRIVDWRTENGPFTSLSQLTLVSGIGIETLNKLSDHATVGGMP